MSAPRTGGRAVPSHVLREFARDRVDRSSLRAIASTIPIGHSTLYNFINGASPHPRVHLLLGEWYLRETGSCAGRGE